MDFDLNELKERISEKSDDELKEILSAKRADYTEDAIKIAKEELKNRKDHPPQIEVIKEKKDKPGEKKEGDYFQGKMDGRSLAKKICHGGIGWGIVAYASYFFFGIFPCSGFFLLSLMGTNPPTKYTLEKIGFSSEYQAGFKKGYRGVTRVNNAIGVGVGIGLGILTTVILHYFLGGK